MTNPDQPSIIQLKNIVQTYDGGKTKIIDGFNFEIKDKKDSGEFVVLLGKSGCGKSTILRYIAGLQKPTEGEVLINGELKSRKKNITMVFQQYSSLPWKTVLENVELGLMFNGTKDKKEIREKAMYFINEVGLSGHEHKFAKFGNLSGGQLQRVAIARSLIANPKIILMDEPFGALDTHTRLKMQTLLADIWIKYQSTVIFVTHDISEAVYLGDEVYIMGNNPGRVLHKINVPLPIVRTPDMKRTADFINTSNNIEDLLWNS